MIAEIVGVAGALACAVSKTDVVDHIIGILFAWKRRRNAYSVDGARSAKEKHLRSNADELRFLLEEQTVREASVPRAERKRRATGQLGLGYKFLGRLDP